MFSGEGGWERELISMQKTRRKMCPMPAQILEAFVPQVKKKDRLKKGMDADVVIFNPDTISDVGTYTAPSQLAFSLQSLLVNDALTVAEGKLIFDAAPGQPIRRPVKKQ